MRVNLLYEIEPWKNTTQSERSYTAQHSAILQTFPMYDYEPQRQETCQIASHISINREKNNEHECGYNAYQARSAPGASF
jgi:hypothetical protein